MIPNLKPLIEPLTTRFPAAWAKAKAPHDDGEFNARVCAVLHHELGMVEVGRNGKRGDPTNLSKDVINWKGEGQNHDPVTGGMGTIIDFIIGHESADADIGQITPDQNGPGAWVKPLTLAQIDEGASPQAQAVLPKAEAFARLTALNAFYAAPEGLQRPGGLVKPDDHGRMVADMEAIAQWFYQLVIEGKSLEQVFAQIRESHEFREKHP